MSENCSNCLDTNMLKLLMKYTHVLREISNVPQSLLDILKTDDINRPGKSKDKTNEDKKK